MSKFSNLKLRYKIGVGVATGAIILGAAGGAFAYIAGGSGTGSGTATSASNETLSNLTAVATVTGLVPGGGGVATSVVVTNPNTYSVQFGRINIVLNETGTPAWPSQCDISGSPAYSWFTTGSDTTGAYTAVEGTTTTFAGPTVAMNDDSVNNQTSCLGKSIPLTVTLSAS